MGHSTTPSGLTAILFNPPLSTGARTKARVALAAKLLGHEGASIANLFPIPTKSVIEVNTIGKDFGLWLLARAEISRQLTTSSDILLAYGCQEPVGEVRTHFRAQVAWLRQEISASVTTVWSVSDRPRHPSRWQRHTAREYPELPFNKALEFSLQQLSPG